MKSDKETQFLELVVLHRGLILKVCSMYARNRADSQDLYQEILFNIWKAFDSFRGESRITTWLYGIALNTAIMNLRKSSRTVLTSNPLDEVVDPMFTESTIGPEDFSQLHQAIRQLPDIDRAIILLYLEELSGKEISKITGFSPVNIRVRTGRIKLRLKSILEKQGYNLI